MATPHYNQEGVLGFRLAEGLLRLLIADQIITREAAARLCERLAAELDKEWRSDVKGLGAFMRELAKSCERAPGA